MILSQSFSERSLKDFEELMFWFVCVRYTAVLTSDVCIFFSGSFQLACLRTMKDSDGGSMQDNFRPPCHMKNRKLYKSFV